MKRIGKEDIYITSSSLDRKRESFARLIATGQDIGDAYNVVFHTNLDEITAFEKGKELCEDEYVKKRINDLFDDLGVYSTVTKENISVTMKRIIDCNASDFFEMDRSGMMRLKPIDKWTRTMKVAFKGIRYTKNGMEIQLYDKIGAANTITKMMGWEKTIDTGGTQNALASWSDDDLRRVIDVKKTGNE